MGASGNIQHWDGQSFTPVSPRPTTEYLRAIRGSGPRDLWVLGDNDIVLHHDGDAWTATRPDDAFTWKGLLVSAPGDVQVVADFGAIMRRRP